MSTEAQMQATLAALDLQLGPAPTSTELLNALEGELRDLRIDYAAGKRSLVDFVGNERFVAALRHLQSIRSRDIAAIEQTLLLNGREVHDRGDA